MKKVLCFFCLLMLFFINLNVVKAVGDCGYVSFNSSTHSPSSVTFGGVQVWNYYVLVNGTQKQAVCRNPGLAAWEQYGGRQQLQCEGIIGDATGGNSGKNAYDAGVIDILTNSSISRDDKWLAINFYQLLFPNYAESNYMVEGDAHSNQIYYFKNQINRYLDESNTDADAKDLRNKVKDLKNRIHEQVGMSYKVSNEYTRNKSGESAHIKRVIKGINHALDAAIENAKNGGTRIDINRTPKREKTQTDTEITNKFTYTFDIQNFSADGEIWIGYSCTGGCSYISTTNFYLNGNKVEGNINSVNLRTLLEEENGNYSGKVTFTMEFIGPKVEECDDTSYNLEFTYRDSRLEKYAYEVSKGNGYQKLYILGGSDTATYRITNLDGSFKFCATKAEADRCKTYISDVTCKNCNEDDNKVEIKEGYDTSDVCEIPKEEDLDIKSCVANNEAKDTAGNTHKNTALTSEAGSSNFENGGIFCKEDYLLTLPGARKVDSGRYFVLKSSLEGTETCYSSKIKSNASTKSQVYSLGEASVDAYNLLKRNQAIMKCLEDDGCPRRGRTAMEDLSCGKFFTGTYKSYRGAYGPYDECASTTETVTEKDSNNPDDPGTKVTRTVWYCESYIIGRRWAPKLTIDVTYDGFVPGACSGTKLSYSETYVGDYGACADPRVDYDNLTESQWSALKAQIGNKAKVTCGGSYDIGKGEGPSCSGPGATGIMGRLGTGAIWSALKSYNKVIGFYTAGRSISSGSITDEGLIESESYTGSGQGSYGVMINPNPFGGWQMNYDFEPEMHFWYPEIYMDDFKTDVLIRSNETATRDAAKYCIGEVSDDYEECYGNGGWKTSLSLGSLGDDNADVYKGEVCACTEATCQFYTYALSNVKYIKQEQKATADFRTPTQAFTLFPSGKIAVANPGTEIQNGDELVNGLPVALGSENGVKNYLLWFENLGEYFDSDKLGRIWGDYNSVIATTLLSQTSEACGNDNPALRYDYTYNSEYKDEGLYVCEYDVNVCGSYTCAKPLIDDNGLYTYTNDKGIFQSQVDSGIYRADCCPSGECPTPVVNKCAIGKDRDGKPVYYDKEGNVVSKSQYEQTCCNGHCLVYCENCLYDGYKLKANYRQITNEDVNPTDRELGKNWAFDEVIDSAVELKAKVTTEEIQNNNNSIFDIDFSKENTSNNFAMQVKMDMQTMSWIRNYNNNHNGYLDSDLDCYDLEYNGKIYKNIYCYSEFIDQILDSEVKDNIKIVGPERPAANGNLRGTNSDKYFTSWIKAGSNNNWEVSSSIALEYTTHFGKEFDEATGKETDYHVGPSWK